MLDRPPMTRGGHAGNDTARCRAEHLEDGIAPGRGGCHQCCGKPHGRCVARSSRAIERAVSRSLAIDAVVPTSSQNSATLP